MSVKSARSESGGLLMTKYTFSRFLLSAICFVSSALLAFNGTEGWGWFIVAGLLSVPVKENS